MAENMLQFPLNLTKSVNSRGEVQENSIDTFMMFAPYGFRAADTKDSTRENTTAKFGKITRIYMYHPQELQTTATTRYAEEGKGFFASALGGDYKDVGFLEGVQRLGAALLGGNVAAMQQKKDGRIINPNLEMFFRGTAYREHSFSFEFTPKSKDEADAAIRIIRTFKKYQQPAGSSGAFMTYPSYWEISEYSHGREMNKFKPAVIISTTLNQAPQSVWAKHEDGTPVTVKLDVNFKEIDLITQGDYDEAEANNTYGY